ncbi:hypothetical protein SAMN05216224_10320 [Thioclava dalianensis]|nr:hypothetical protein SAMN05216224_10320 [Thioclava dalianensis]
MDIPNLILWGIALIVTIVLGVWGIRASRSRKSQNQDVRGGSTGIQSGRDTKIK